MFAWLHPRHVPLIVAHRGASAVAPENTLAAFRRAIQDGADAIELDVRLTADDEVVVIHDRMLERTTDGAGRVHDWSLKELKKLDAGEWFDKKFERERIPTLSEVIEAVEKTVGINIELKCERGGRIETNIVERCCEIVCRHRATSRILISSFSFQYVKKVKALLPEVATGMLYHPIDHFGTTPVSLVKKARANFLILSRTTARKRIIHAAHDAGIPIGEYTVDTRRSLQRSLRFGVDAIVTNDPRTIRSYLNAGK